MKTLIVYWGSELVGYLTKAGNQYMAFQYAESYLASSIARPISLSLPLQTKPITDHTARSWFANLLPEGEIRGQVARKLGVSERNEFAILAGIGGDCAGALRLLPGGLPSDEQSKLIPLPWEKLEEDIAASPRPSLLVMMMNEGELRLSLAGAQDKLPVHYTQGEIALPTGAAASTHLLKIPSRVYPDLVQNEFYCLTLARQIGLRVPPAFMATPATPILLIERFDRFRNPDGHFGRFHQEDFCQALGVPPETKYENEGGPSLTQLFAALAQGSSSPLPDKRDLIRWVLFNFIIGNADAHAKNLAFMIGGLDASTQPRLAPFYDLICTEVYAGLSRKQAHKIGGEYRPDRIERRHWDRFAEAIQIKQKYLRQVGVELSDKVEEQSTDLAEEIGASHGGAKTLTRITKVIGQRLRWLRTSLGE